MFCGIQVNLKMEELQPVFFAAGKGPGAAMETAMETEKSSLSTQVLSVGGFQGKQRPPPAFSRLAVGSTYRVFLFLRPCFGGPKREFKRTTAFFLSFFLCGGVR